MKELPLLIVMYCKFGSRQLGFGFGFGFRVRVMFLALPLLPIPYQLIS